MLDVVRFSSRLNSAVRRELVPNYLDSARHGGIGTRLIVRLGNYVESKKLGAVYGPDTSFQIGRNERLPDVSFISIQRFPAEGEPEGIWTIVPDLAVEIISPNDLYEKVMTKVMEYLSTGVKQVWLISPEHKTLSIYHSLTDITVLTENDELVSDDLIPDFRLQIKELFQPIS